jgi:hypothetical protein
VSRTLIFNLNFGEKSASYIRVNTVFCVGLLVAEICEAPGSRIARTSTVITVSVAQQKIISFLYMMFSVTAQKFLDMHCIR